MSFDLVKFIKVMKMTSSSHEGEALAALRTATRMMAAAKVTWDDILKPKVTVKHTNDARAYQPNSGMYQDPFGQRSAYEEYVRAERDRVFQELRQRMAEAMRNEEEIRKAKNSWNPFKPGKNWSDL